MNNKQRMMAWSSSWALIGGTLVCTGCMRGQSITDSDRTFAHDSRCKAKDEVTKLPWAELHQILDDERG
jgi:cytochrome c-type biogenesis protein CcmH/NrfF